METTAESHSSSNAENNRPCTATTTPTPQAWEQHGRAARKILRARRPGQGTDLGGDVCGVEGDQDRLYEIFKKLIKIFCY